MDYLPYLLKQYELDLQPTNSTHIDIESTKSILYPGAHIATGNPYEHYHHGIVIDTNAPDMLIIHLWGPDKNNNHIQTTTLPIFIAGGIQNLEKKNRRLYLVKYNDDNLDKQIETVNVAKQMIDKADEIIYDLASLNCESFACFCRTGRWHSEQIEKIKNLFMEEAVEICEILKDADGKNRKNIASVLKAIPLHSINPSDKALYHQICQDYGYKIDEQ